MHLSRVPLGNTQWIRVTTQVINLENLDMGSGNSGNSPGHCQITCRRRYLQISEEAVVLTVAAVVLLQQRMAYNYRCVTLTLSASKLQMLYSLQCFLVINVLLL